MKIRTVGANNRKRAFEVAVGRRTLPFPYVKADPAPRPADPVRQVSPDDEVGREAFTYVLRSGRAGTVHLEQVLEYNRDPSHRRDVLLYRLTIEAQKRVDTGGLSRREIARRLGTSATQLYRLLDQTNYQKSFDQILSLLELLDCEVDVVVRAKSA